MYSSDTKSNMTLSKLLLFVVASAFLLAACTRTDQPVATPTASPTETEPKRIRSADVVKASVSPITIESGGTTDALVKLTIQDGYHINANPPTYPYLKATELEVPASGGISLVTVAYPSALKRKFAFAEEPLGVYEGTADLKATLKADTTAKPGEQSIPAQLRIQACDEQVCYPPGTLELAIPVSIK